MVMPPDGCLAAACGTAGSLQLSRGTGIDDSSAADVTDVKALKKENSNGLYSKLLKRLQRRQPRHPDPECGQEPAKHGRPQAMVPAEPVRPRAHYRDGAQQGGHRPMTQRVRQQGVRKRDDEEPQGEDSGMPGEVSETTTPPLRRAGDRFECPKELVGVGRPLGVHVGHDGSGASQEWLFRACSHRPPLPRSRPLPGLAEPSRESSRTIIVGRPRRTGRTSSVLRAAALASATRGLVNTIPGAPFSRISYNQRYRTQNPRLFLNRGTDSRHRAQLLSKYRYLAKI
jgi:hypothetical protein